MLKGTPLPLTPQPMTRPLRGKDTVTVIEGSTIICDQALVPPVRLTVCPAFRSSLAHQDKGLVPPPHFTYCFLGPHGTPCKPGKPFSVKNESRDTEGSTDSDRHGCAIPNATLAAAQRPAGPSGPAQGLGPVVSHPLLRLGGAWAGVLRQQEHRGHQGWALTAGLAGRREALETGGTSVVALRGTEEAQAGHLFPHLNPSGWQAEKSGEACFDETKPEL